MQNGKKPNQNKVKQKTGRGIWWGWDWWQQEQTGTDKSRKDESEPYYMVLYFETPALQGKMGTNASPLPY